MNVRTILKRRLWKTHEVANLDCCNKQSRPMKSAAKVKILSHPGKQTQLFLKLLKILDFFVLTAWSNDNTGRRRNLTQRDFNISQSQSHPKPKVWRNWELCLEVDWDISVEVWHMKWEMVSVEKERELYWECCVCDFHLISGDRIQFPTQRKVVLRLSGIRCVYSLQAHLEIFATISSNNLFSLSSFPGKDNPLWVDDALGTLVKEQS